MTDWALAGAAAGDNRHRACSPQVTPERVGVIAAVGEKPSKPAWRSCNDLRRSLYVTGVAGREVDDRRAAEDIGDDVDLGGLAAPRDADGLRLRPPLPPWAERCALM